MIKLESDHIIIDNEIIDIEKYDKENNTINIFIDSYKNIDFIIDNLRETPNIYIEDKKNEIFSVSVNKHNFREKYLLILKIVGNLNKKEIKSKIDNCRINRPVADKIIKMPFGRVLVDFGDNDDNL